MVIFMQRQENANKKLLVKRQTKYWYKMYQVHLFSCHTTKFRYIGMHQISGVTTNKFQNTNILALGAAKVLPHMSR